MCVCDFFFSCKASTCYGVLDLTSRQVLFSRTFYAPLCCSLASSEMHGVWVLVPGAEFGSGLTSESLQAAWEENAVPGALQESIHLSFSDGVAVEREPNWRLSERIPRDQ